MFGFFKSKKITGKLSGIELPLKKSMTLLDNALEEGFSVPYSCKSGSCKECLCLVEKGEVESLVDLRRVLTTQQIDKGHFLACQTLPLDDVSYSFINVPQENYHPAKIQKVTRLSPKTYRVTIEFTTENFTHAPVIGQSCKIKKVHDGESRYYSVSQIHQADQISFDISYQNNGVFSTWLCNPKNVGSNIYMSDFTGSFGENASNTSCNIAIAGGSALGIVLGLIEKILDKKNHQEILFIHATRSIDDAYDENRLQKLHSTYPSFNYVRVISGDTLTSTDNTYIKSKIYTGRIQKFLTSDHFEQYIEKINIHDTSCLICGAQTMATDVIDILQKKGMARSKIDTDFFE